MKCKRQFSATETSRCRCNGSGNYYELYNINHLRASRNLFFFLSPCYHPQNRRWCTPRSHDPTPSSRRGLLFGLKNSRETNSKPQGREVDFNDCRKVTYIPTQELTGDPIQGRIVPNPKCIPTRHILFSINIYYYGYFILIDYKSSDILTKI